MGIVIADRFQGRKLGHLAMKLLMIAAEANGRSAIELTTHPRNEAAFHLYKKLGFQYVGDTDLELGDRGCRTERQMVYTIERQ